MATGLGPIAEQLNESLWEWDLGISLFLLPSADSNVQPGLRTTNLV